LHRLSFRIYEIDRNFYFLLKDIVVSPPACYLEHTRGILGPKVRTAGQNSYKAAKGAFTGDLSPQMLIDVGADWVILGHSERRNVFGEDDQV
jgi:triosephosphate isomerase (TIM)